MNRLANRLPWQEFCPDENNLSSFDPLVNYEALASNDAYPVEPRFIGETTFGWEGEPTKRAPEQAWLKGVRLPRPIPPCVRAWLAGAPRDRQTTHYLLGLNATAPELAEIFITKRCETLVRLGGHKREVLNTLRLLANLRRTELGA